MSLTPRRPDHITVAGERTARFGAFVRDRASEGRLVVQPRMGFGTAAEMRAGLAATKAAQATTVGTITLDSYTRVGDLTAAERALRAGAGLNGYPLVTHAEATTRGVLAGLHDESFPVQVRHGSAVPGDIFTALMRCGITATEGGPVSYCLPYGRTPLHDSVRNWAECCERFAALRDIGLEPHLETFGGCMLGQLCPPSQLLALSVLEALFFRSHGLRSVSVSYAQQTNAEQDREAVLALRRLCRELLPDVDWHVVIYAYMGVYPTTPAGANLLLGQAAELAAGTGSERLIVKTAAEARRIPTVAENIAALELADRSARSTRRTGNPAAEDDSQTYEEASALIGAVLNLGGDIGQALLRAFQCGYLDIPYCLHPDNAGRTRSYLDDRGRLCWAETGALPIAHLVQGRVRRPATSQGLLGDLAHNRHRWDELGRLHGTTELGAPAHAPLA